MRAYTHTSTHTHSSTHTQAHTRTNLCQNDLGSSIVGAPTRLRMSGDVSIRQHTSAYVSYGGFHTPAYVRRCQHTSAYVSCGGSHTSELRQIRQYLYFCTSTRVSICTSVLVKQDETHRYQMLAFPQHFGEAEVSDLHTSSYASIRQHT